MATKLKEVLKKDLVKDKVDPTVKVDDVKRLYGDLRDFVMTEEIAIDALKLVRAISGQLQELQRGSVPQAVVDACWLSGFFGTGKSHLAKLIAALIHNPVLTHQGISLPALDLFHQTHEPATQTEKDLKAELTRLSRLANATLIAFEITAAKKGVHDSISAIFLRKFFEGLGYAASLWIARIERDLEERGLYDKFKSAVSSKGMGNWEQERQATQRVPAIFRQVLPEVDPTYYRNEDDVEAGIEKAEDEAEVSPEGFVEEVNRYLERKAQEEDGRIPLAFFVVDEVGQFIAANSERIEEIRSIVERGAVVGNGRIFSVMTSQEDLAAAIGGVIKGDQMSKLNARFGVKIDLKSQNVSKIVRERLLIKNPTGATELSGAFGNWKGPISELENLQTRGVTYPTSDPATFAANYPLLAYQVQLSQDILATLRGPRLSGTERSMIQIVQEAVSARSEDDLGILIPFDAVFDANESELSSIHHLGTHGVKEINDSDDRLGWTDTADFAQPSRILKILYLIQRLEEKGWIPQTADTIAKLMADHVNVELTSLRKIVIKGLESLVSASMVSFDGASYHFLSQEEREIEQYFLDRKGKVRIPDLERDIKDRGREILAANKITDGTQQYQLKYGSSGQALFGFETKLDGEVVSPPGGGPLTLELYTPLSGFKLDQIRTANLADGSQGKTVHWIADETRKAELAEILRQIRALQDTINYYQPKADRDEISAAAKDAIRKKRTDLTRTEKKAGDLITQAFMKGRLLFSGEEHTLPVPEADTLKKVLSVAGNVVVPSLFDRFHLADKTYDDRDAVYKAIFNPAGNLATLEGIRNLNLVDAQGHIKAQTGMVSEILNALTMLENTQAVVKAQDLRRKLQDIPYGWPRSVIQLAVAVLFRCGQIEITHKGNPAYDFRQLEDAYKVFSKISSFDAVEIRKVTDILTPDEIQAAYLFCKNTLQLDHVTESVNDIFLQFRDYRTGLEHFKTTLADFVAQGLPLPNPIQERTQLLESSKAKSKPQELVKWILDNQDDLKELHEQVSQVKNFVESNKIALQNALPLIKRAEASQVLRQKDRDGSVSEAISQLKHLISNRQVVSGWADFQNYRAVVENAYRSAYKEYRGAFEKEVQSLEKGVKARPEFTFLPPDEQQTIISEWFGAQSLARAGISQQSIETLKELLDADQATSLDALAGRVGTVAGLLADVLFDIQELPQGGEDDDSGDEPIAEPRMRSWRPKSITKGMIIRKEDTEEIADKFKQEMEEQFEEDIEEVIVR